MAQAVVDKSAAASEKGGASKAPGLLIPLVVLTLVSVMGGAAFSAFFLAPADTVAEQTVKKPAKPAPMAAENAALQARFPSDAVEVPLKPIVVNTIGQGQRMVRLEGTLIVDHDARGHDILKAQIEEDIVTYLKGVSVEETFGVRGFQNLREDLDDRAKIRGQGVVLGLLITGFIFE